MGRRGVEGDRVKLSFLRRKVRCPHCQGVLEKKPTRRNKCPHCGQYMRVRRGQLLTEEEALRIDQEAKECAFIARWLTDLASFGITQQDFDKNRDIASKKMGSAASSHNVIWGLLNEAAVRAMKAGEPQDLKMVYLLQANFVLEEGRDPRRLLAESHRWDLRAYQSLGVEKVEVTTAPGEYVCSACRAISGQVLTIEDALEQVPVPTRCEQDNGWCRCCYLPVLDIE